MRLVIAGGCGEYGRNCFFIEEGETAFLVDCGLMEQDSVSPYPRLSPGQIQKAAWLFLTHSHRDHAGGYAWLRQHGFRGGVVASAETLRQTGITAETVVVSDHACQPGQEERLTAGLSFRWGRSGHCAGSVWYDICFSGKQILFSGDYIEDSLAYSCHPLRGRSADLALLDCAYGLSETTAEQYRETVRQTLGELLSACGLVLLPVPLYGRGLDLLLLACREFPRHTLYPGQHLRREAVYAQNIAAWYRQPALAALRRLDGSSAQEWSPGKRGVVFLADTHLKQESSREMAGAVVRCGGRVLLTGKPDAGSYAAQLLQNGQAAAARYAVHSSEATRKMLMQHNAFAATLPVHSEAYPSPEWICL